jgi:hypothetical protein
MESVSKTSRKLYPSPTFLLLIYQVMLAAGNDVPTWHVALRLSFAKRVFFSTIIRGSSLGSSITCMIAVRMSVWNSGASSETSHWNCPVKSLVTPRSVTDVASECESWSEKMRLKLWIHQISQAYINIDSRNWKRSCRRRFFRYKSIKLFGLKVPSNWVETRLLGEEKE